MATIAIMIGGAIANAVAFTGGNYLMHYLEGGSKKEHDLAVEELNKKTIEWNQHRQQTLDYLNQQLDQQNNADRELYDVDEALKIYNKVHNTNLSLPPRPMLKDFYKPQKNYEYYFIIASTLIGSVVAYKFL